MNRWECQGFRCLYFAYGTGGAIGLRAIGWYFRKGEGANGPTLYCPRCRPDKIPCVASNPDVAGQPCSECRADAEADACQDAIRAIAP